MNAKELAYIRARLMQQAILRLPDRIRGPVLESASVEAGGVLGQLMAIEFSGASIKFARSRLFDAIRKLLGRSVGSKCQIADVTGAKHQFRKTEENGRPSAALLLGEKKRIGVWHFGLFSPSTASRLRVFTFHAKAASLPETVAKNWSNILRERPLGDEEYVVLQKDFADAPIAIAQVAKSEIQSGEFNLEHLIPTSERYYDWLVGACLPDEPIDKFIKRAVLPQMRALVRNDEVEGAKQAALLAIRADIALGLLTPKGKIFEGFCSWVAAEGDPFSCVAAIEAGLAKMGKSKAKARLLPQLADRLIFLLKEESQNQVALLSALMFAVMGEMSRRRTHADRPPYWRRLAAIAHATMLARCFPPNVKLPSALLEQIKGSRMEQVMIQNFADMRLEPSWSPEYLLPEQLKNELGGRAIVFANSHAEIVKRVGLADRFLGTGPGSIGSVVNMQKILLPGPLEGHRTALLDLKLEHRARFNRELRARKITKLTFTMITANSQVFKIPSETLDLLVKAIEHNDYRLDFINADKSSFDDLFWLATTAAIFRHKGLSDVVFALLRVSPTLRAKPLAPEELFVTALASAAAHGGMRDWSECVGRAVTNIAFGSLSPEDATTLTRYLRYLCHVVPELWSTCGQAEAAMQSVMAR